VRRDERHWRIRACTVASAHTYIKVAVWSERESAETWKGAGAGGIRKV
jgi:hypothetical protein